MHLDWFLSDLFSKMGISGKLVAVVVVLFTALYFVIKWAVRNGIEEAWKKREEAAQKNGAASRAADDMQGAGPRDTQL